MMQGCETLRVLLFMIVRNEEKILERCLRAAEPFVDAALIVDTGSTDGTVALARGYDGKLRTFVVEDQWRDFGHNRTRSWEAARRCCERDLAWSLESTYGLTIDADMLLRGDPAAFRASALLDLLRNGLGGALLVQRQADVEYTNLRLLRLSDPWVCVGSTHEVWISGDEEAPQLLVDAEMLSIDDVGDGGCKEAKLERDERMLLAGLADSTGHQVVGRGFPLASRYLFYLAQTYVSLKKFDLACSYFQRRIDEGEGWVDELWYSWYQMGRLRFLQGDFDEATRCLEAASEVQPERAEALLILGELARRKNDFPLAWSYLLRAEALERPTDHRLFLEPAAYGMRRLVERMLLCSRDPTSQHTSPILSMDVSLACLNGGWEQVPDLAFPCLVVHTQVAVGARRRLAISLPLGYVSSNASLTGDLLCVRAVNYRIAADGSYDLRQGFMGTRNFLARWKGLSDLIYTDGELLELQVDPSANRRASAIVGLEDVRLQGSRFTATTQEYSYCEAYRMVLGELRLAGAAGGPVTAKIFPLRPPVETDCERNWLLMPTEEAAVIYGWHPLSIYSVVPPSNNGVGALQLRTQHPTPTWFQFLRGSTAPFLLRGKLWVLTHLVAPTQPRCYLHCWLWLDAGTGAPLAHSRPFVFFHRGVEHCTGAAPHASFEGGLPDSIVMFVSVLDRETWVVTSRIEDVESTICNQIPCG